MKYYNLSSLCQGADRGGGRRGGGGRRTLPATPAAAPERPPGPADPSRELCNGNGQAPYKDL